MKNLLFLLTILTISCTPPTRQQQLATNICDCYQPLDETLQEMTKEYKSTYFRMEVEKIKWEHKANDWLPMVERNLDWLNAYRDSLHTTTAAKKYNLVKAILLTSVAHMLGEDFSKLSFTLQEKKVTEYDEEIDATLRNGYFKLREIFKNIRNMQERNMDMKIKDHINKMDQQTFLKYFRPPGGLYKKAREFYKCTYKVLIPAIENDFTLWSDSLRNAINDECPQAAKWLF